jgi:arylformamidase
MWMEGPAYEKKSIYKIEGTKFPPVNYDEHVLRPHSLTHVETPAHTIKDGATLETFGMEYFFGRTQVIRLKGNRYRELGGGLFHWVIDVSELPSIVAP